MKDEKDEGEESERNDVLPGQTVYAIGIVMVAAIVGLGFVVLAKLRDESKAQGASRKHSAKSKQ